MKFLVPNYSCKLPVLSNCLRICPILSIRLNMPHTSVISLLYIKVLILPSAHPSSLNVKEEVQYAYTRRASKIIL